MQLRLGTEAEDCVITGSFALTATTPATLARVASKTEKGSTKADRVRGRTRGNVCALAIRIKIDRETGNQNVATLQSWVCLTLPAF